MRLNCDCGQNPTKQVLVLFILLALLASGDAHASQTKPVPSKSTTKVSSSARIKYGAVDLTPLNLTDEQKSRIQNDRKENAVKMRELRLSLKKERRILKDMYFDPNANESQILNQAKEVRTLYGKTEEMMVEDLLTVRRVLTPQQLKQLPEIKPKRASEK